MSSRHNLMAQKLQYPVFLCKQVHSQIVGLYYVRDPRSLAWPKTYVLFMLDFTLLINIKGQQLLAF